VRRLLVTLALAVTGATVALYGLTRLGWRRHGTPAGDLGFLHIDWITNRSLPYWRAHVENLAILAAGILITAVGVALAARRGFALRAGHRRRGQTLQP
jgi:hypothetical protein